MDHDASLNQAEIAYERDRAAYLASAGTLRNPPGERTGWPPGLLQDDCSAMSHWFASRPDARAVVDRLAAMARWCARASPP